jgi:hypothetical protein
MLQQTKNGLREKMMSPPRAAALRCESEGFGLVYERFAVGKLLEKLVTQYNIRTVLEIPGGGIKAMPSISSLCMALAGCKVTVVNGEKASLKAWKRLGLGDMISFIQCDDISNTSLPDNSFDFVWSFVVFGTLNNPESTLKEMKRLAKRYVALFLANKRNVGYYFHRFAHWYTKIPWNHGDVTLRTRKRIKDMMKDQGIEIEKVGFVDTPPWPDSIGFRDIRLHRLAMESKLELAKFNWTSHYVDFLESQRFPLWIKLVYAFESIPVPYFLKQFYAHLFYVLGDVSKNSH